jgi:hypothetical protein
MNRKKVPWRTFRYRVGSKATSLSKFSDISSCSYSLSGGGGSLERLASDSFIATGQHNMHACLLQQSTKSDRWVCRSRWTMIYFVCNTSHYYTVTESKLDCVINRFRRREGVLLKCPLKYIRVPCYRKLDLKLVLDDSSCVTGCHVFQNNVHVVNGFH